MAGRHDPREAWDRRLAARRAHRGRRFVVKLVVVAVVAAVAAAVDGASSTRDPDANVVVGEPEATTTSSSSSSRDPGAARVLLNERAHLATAAVHRSRRGRRRREDASAPWLRPADAAEEEEDVDHCGSVAIDAARDKCAHVARHCGTDATDGLVDYRRLHYCVMRPHPTLSAVLLLAVVVAAFYLLGETSEERFCPVVRRLADALELSPSAAGVTLLALGNGAPDVFACLAAFSASGGGGGGSRGGTLSAVPGGDVGGGMIGATLRRVVSHPGPHTTPCARCTPFLEDFTSRRRFSPPRVTRFQSRLLASTAFNSD